MKAGTQTTLTPTSNVLITGVTGLIGGELFRRLQTFTTIGKIWPLIRPASERDPVSRLRNRLERSGDGPEIGANVQVVPGDMLEPDWGMDDSDFDAICSDVDIIIHNAADTSFKTERDPSKTNVEGVKRLIELAGKCRRTPLIVYMSTASNIGDVAGACVSEDDGCRADNRHHNDYTRSKAIAENLIRSSGLPVLTLRPTIVLSAGLPDSQFARQILWSMPISRVFEALPLNPDSRIDIVDVNYVAESSLRLLRKSMRAHDCYHLSAGTSHAISARELTSLVDRHYRRKTPLQFVPPSEWTRAVHKTYVRTKLQRRLYSSLRYYLPFVTMDVVYDDLRLRRELGDDLPRVRPVGEYLCDLLKLIATRAALQEAAMP
jgi:thioester reductase-like protein